MQTIKFKRATRAQIDAAAIAGSLKLGEPYAITDEGRLAIGESASAYTAFLKGGEGSGEVTTPTNTSPANNAVDVVPPLVISAGAFSSTGSAPHATARYQLSTINNFTLPDYDSGEVAAAASYTIEPGIVGYAERVFWRIQFIDAHGVLSDWSAPTQFEARGVSVVTKPTNTLPVNGATDTKRSQPLTASAFVSTQGALHQATRLQIGGSTSFASPRIDVTLGAVTDYKIPRADFVLDATEYWRVQYQNDLGIWSEWSDATGYTTGDSAVEVLGGTITSDGDYNVHTFTASGTLEIIDAPTEMDVLVVAGGGGGGSVGGGGGGGGVVYKTAQIVAAGSYAVAVGGGGNGGAQSGAGADGSGSSVASIASAVGGGAGSAWRGTGAVGGSGGGSFSGASAAGTLGQGYAGGTGVDPAGGGGGGGGAIGASAADGGVPGNGGAGFACAISPAATHYAGGGGGCAQVGYTALPNSVGGIGGGGAGGDSAGVAGAPNTGGGGGAGAYAGASSQPGGAGGSGIVIVRYHRYLVG